MTSRERILAAINFQEADRMPIDVGGGGWSGLNIDEYCLLLKELGSDIIPTVVNQADMVAKIDPIANRRLHGDAVLLGRPNFSFNLRNENWKKWTTFRGNTVLMPGNFNPREDENGDLWIDAADGTPLGHMPKGGYYFDYATGASVRDDFPKMSPEAWAASIPSFSDEDLKWLEREAKRLYEETDLAVMAAFDGAKLLTVTTPFAGMTPTEQLVTMLLEPDYMNELFEATTEVAIKNTDVYLNTVDKYIDVILMSTMDYGTQRGPLFSPDLFGQLITPHYRRINDFIHRKYKVKTLIHTCGSVYSLIPHIIDSGFDILNPLQFSSDHMDPVQVKQNFGGKIAFWGGGISTQTTLPFGSKEEVIEEVKRKIKILAPGGGYVFATEHCIQYGVPIENLLAMVDTAYEHGKYPIHF